MIEETNYKDVVGYYEPEPTLGIFYTCYTEQKAIEYSLDVLFDIYENIPVYLVSEGNINFDYLQKKHPSVKTQNEIDTFGFLPTLDYETFRTDEIQDKILLLIYTFLDRLNRACDYCKTSHILIFEPDVLVRGKIPIYKDAKITGCRVNTFNYESAMETRKLMTEIDTSIKFEKFGAVASILEIKTFKKVYDFVLKNTEFIKKLAMSSEHIANYDLLLPILYALNGYEEIDNSEYFTECIRNPNWQTSHHPLLHQFREHYPKSNYDGRHK